MKQGFLSIGKALVYFAVFFLIQLWAGVLFIFGTIVWEVVRSSVFHDAISVMDMIDAALTAYVDNAMLVTLISGAATVLAYVLSFTMRRKPVLQGMSLKPVRVPVLAAAMLLGLALNPVVSLLLELLPLPEEWLDNYAESAAMLEKGSPVVIFLASVIAAPVSEELAFRGLVHTRLKRAMPTWLAAILSSVLFGALHGDLVWFMYAALLGLLLTWIFERSGSVWTSIACHMGFNGCAQLLELVPEWHWSLIAGSILLTAAALFWLISTTKSAKKAQTFT